MNPEEIKQKILNIFKNHLLTVISTVDVSGTKPESAIIAFAEKDNLELVFGTSNLSRKYKNIQVNSYVSFVIGWSRETGSVQYEGVARELSGAERDEHAALMVKKNPKIEKFLARAEQRFFLVKPVWLRLVDTTVHPDKVSELTF